MINPLYCGCPIWNGNSSNFLLLSIVPSSLPKKVPLTPIFLKENETSTQPAITSGSVIQIPLALKPALKQMNKCNIKTMILRVNQKTINESCVPNE